MNTCQLLNCSNLLAAIVAALCTGCATPQLADFCGPLSHEAVAGIDQEKRQLAEGNRVYAAITNNVYESSSHPEIWIDPAEWQAVCAPTEENPLGTEGCPAETGGNGLQAKTWLRWPHGRSSEPSELVFAFRGTTTINDWWCGNIWDCQYDDANEYVSKRIGLLREKYPRLQVVATGHSLGGGLAQHVAFCFKDVKAVGFNTSPRTHKGNCRGADFKLRAVQEDINTRANIVRIHQHAEILSLIRWIWSGGKRGDTSYNFTRATPIARHGMTVLAMGLNKVAACPIVAGKGGFSAPGEPRAETWLRNTCRTAQIDFRCSNQAVTASQERTPVQ